MADELEPALRALARDLDVPPPPDVTAAVLARLDTPPDPVRHPARRVLAAALAALVALVTAMVVSPAVRAAVFDLLRVGGVELHQDEPPPTPTGGAPLPGQHEMSLAQAHDAVDFTLRLPTGLGDPDSVLVTDGRVVTLSYGDVRLDQFDGRLDPVFHKFAMAEGVHQVRVGGLPGIWVDRPHTVVYVDEHGTVHEEAARLAGSTLIWEDAGVTYRLEGALTENEAVTIAESMS